MNKSTKVSRHVAISGVTFSVVVETIFSTMHAYTAIHDQAFPRRIGGIRFASRGGLEEVGHLASAMTHKCGAALIPFDGQKSLIETSEGIPTSSEEKAQIIEAHLDDVISVDPGATLGPDMYAGEDVMSRLGMIGRLSDHITGRSLAQGGLGIDSNGATAAGLAAAISRVAEELPQAPKTVVIQGFGAVGGDLARRLHDVGITLRAVSNAKGTLVAKDNCDLNVSQLLAMRVSAQSGRFDDGELERYSCSDHSCDYFPGDRQQIFKVPCDIFVPAARTMVLAQRGEIKTATRENAECVAVEDFYESARPRIVAEGANYPISERGEVYLEGKGVRVLTDYLVNMGGVVGCLFEWAYQPELQDSPTAHKKINDLATKWTEMVGRRNMETLLAAKGGGGRRAGYSLARSNMKEMHSLLGRVSSDDNKRVWIQNYISHVMNSHKR